MSSNNTKHYIRGHNSITSDIIFIDGISGSGKSLLNPIVSCMSNVEKIKYKPSIDFLTILYYQGKIDKDAYSSFLIMQSNEDQYNNLIGREVNLRWNDTSGIKPNTGSFKYFKRLFARDGDHIVEKINKNNIALNIMTQFLLPYSAPLFEVFGKRLKIIEIVRHPLYLVNNFVSFISRIDGPRVNDLVYDFQGHKIPWYLTDDVESFVSFDDYNKAIFIIIELYKKMFSFMDNNSFDDQILYVTFEEMALNTDSTLLKLSNFLERDYLSNLNSVLRKAKLPRKILLDGISFGDYGFERSTQDDEQAQYMEMLEAVNKNALEDNFNKFQKIIYEFNNKFPSKLSSY